MADQDRKLLELDTVDVAYGESKILREVSLTIGPDELVCLMGRNGVGKTTTLNTIVGVLKAQSGRVMLDGEEVGSFKPEARAHKGIAYVPQGREIFPNLTVRENLQIGMLSRGFSKDDTYKEVMTLFPVIEEMLNRKGGVLSGGQQQQLAIARALLTKPKLLILDEPTEGIQPSIIDQIEDSLKSLRERGGLSILLVEQYVEFARALADRFYIMDRGRVVLHGNIDELKDEIVKEHLTV